MTRKQFRWALAVAAAAAVGLPGLGTRYRRQRQPRCALDGAAIESIYAVETEDAEQGLRRFCCIRCAEYWLARQAGADREVRVTDEVTGRPVDAGEAFFVRSTVVTNHATGNRIHAFRRRHAAEEHAASHRGRLLTGEDRPFSTSLSRSEYKTEHDGSRH